LTTKSDATTTFLGLTVLEFALTMDRSPEIIMCRENLFKWARRRFSFEIDVR
jgi:hypothetical protein